MVPATKRSGGIEDEEASRHRLDCTLKLSPAAAGTPVSQATVTWIVVVAAGAVGGGRRHVGRLDHAGAVGRPDLDRVRTRAGRGRVPGDEPLDPRRVEIGVESVAVCQAPSIATSTFVMPRSGAQATPAIGTRPAATVWP